MDAVALTPEQARCLLAHLDIPDCGCLREPLDCGHDHLCDCPILLPPPCPHVLARNHSLTCQQWALLCLLACPAEYAEPLAPTLPGWQLLRVDRVAIYRARHALGLSLWHKGDRWRRQPTNDRDLSGPLAARLDNGYLDPHQRLASQRAQ